MMRTYFIFFLLFLPSLFSQAILEGERSLPLESTKGMVVTSHQQASTAALKVLQKGHNAIDSAVTAAFVLAVTQPRSGNIGGGGFMLISSEKTGKVTAIDYREKAPALATKDMYLNTDGSINKRKSRFSHQAVGVPGTVAGLALALKEYGTITLAESLAPAIKLAEEGFVVTPRFVKGIKARHKELKKWPSSRKIFFKKDGSFYELGDRFVQKDLAKTLRRIARLGVKGFYEGETAKLMTQQMQQNGGLISASDLKAYRAKIRQPIHGTYRGYDVYSMSPPSSGGVHIVQMLNVLELYPLREYGHNSAQSIHLMTEVMKQAYADRAHYLGDSDFVRVPLKALSSKEYAKKIQKQINLRKATPSTALSHAPALPYESHETTHFSVADSFGNAVSNTYTLNFSYGSHIVVEGAGFLLNNEMDDFSAKPGVANAYGLIGGKANQIEAEKRMLSSMSPTILKKNGKNFLITGTPGGSRIITTTLQIILNVIDHQLNIQSAVNAPRIHHQCLPDELRIEEGLSPDTIKILEVMGHKVQKKTAMGASQSILIREGLFYGAADPRRSTSSAQGL